MEQNKKFDDFFEIYMDLDNEAEQYVLLDEFLSDCSAAELFAWNDYIASKSNLEEIVARGLTEEDHAFFKAEFAKFDALEGQLKIRQAA